MLKATLAMFLATGIIGSFVAVDSLAVFTDQKANGSNQFDTGTISLTDAPASALVTFTTMAPGDLVIQPLTVTNSGTLDLRYSMIASATNADGKALKDQLVLTVRTKTVNPCTNEDGAIIAGPGPLSAQAFGSNVQGAQAGDRTITAAANEILCFKVQLPLATGNAYQGATTTATFTFDAEQTRNNP